MLMRLTMSLKDKRDARAYTEICFVSLELMRTSAAQQKADMLTETKAQLLMLTAAYHSLTAYDFAPLQSCRRVVTHHSACPLPHTGSKSCMGACSG